MEAESQSAIDPRYKSCPIKLDQPLIAWIKFITPSSSFGPSLECSALESVQISWIGPLSASLIFLDLALVIDPTGICNRSLNAYWFSSVCLQTDSLLATKWLNNNLVYSMEFSNLILDCRWLLNRDWEARVEHVWREANSCADLLAKRGASQFEREILYDICPIFLWQCLY